VDIINHTIFGNDPELISEKNTDNRILPRDVVARNTVAGQCYIWSKADHF